MQALPQERVAAVRPFWETETPDERTELLTLDVAALRERASALTERYQKQAGACRMAKEKKVNQKHGDIASDEIVQWRAAALTECYQKQAGPSPNGSRSMGHSDDGTWCGSGTSQCSRCRRLCSCSTSAKVSAKCTAYRHAGHIVQLLTNVLLKLIKLPNCCALSHLHRRIL